jgi:cytochrome P450
MGPVVEIRYAVHDALFTAYDNEASWGITHQIMMPLLTPSSVKDDFVGMRDTASQMTGRWTKPIAPINVTNDLQRLSLKATVVYFFGQDIGCLEGPEPSMIQAMDDAALESLKRPNRPKFVNWLLFEGKIAKETKTMRDFAAKIVAKTREDKDPRKDMLHALLGGKGPGDGQSVH